MTMPVRALVALDCRVVEVDPDPRRDEHRLAVDEHVEVRVHVVLEELGVLGHEARLARERHRVRPARARALSSCAGGGEVAVLRANAASFRARALRAASAAAAGGREEQESADRGRAERHAATLAALGWLRDRGGTGSRQARREGAPDQPLDRRPARLPASRAAAGRSTTRRSASRRARSTSHRARRSAARSPPRRRRSRPGARSRSRAARS